MIFDRQNGLLHVYGPLWNWGFLEKLQFFCRFTRLSIAQMQENYRRSNLTRIGRGVDGFRFWRFWRWVVYFLPNSSSDITSNSLSWPDSVFPGMTYPVRVSSSGMDKRSSTSLISRLAAQDTIQISSVQTSLLLLGKWMLCCSRGALDYYND